MLIESLTQDLSPNKAESFTWYKNILDWIGFIIAPVSYLIKIFCISWILQTGMILINKQIHLVDILSIVVLSDMIFLAPHIIKAVWFTFNYDYTFQDIQHFFPGSILNLFSFEKLEGWLTYPLLTLNIWELIFMLMLSVGLKKYMDGDFYRSLSFVAATYGTGLVIWVTFVTFLTLNFT